LSIKTRQSRHVEVLDGAVMVPLEDLTRLAVDGDRDALEKLVEALRPDVYGLALRMLPAPFS
jgi:hypothetical protein